MELKADYEKIGTIGVNVYKEVEILKNKREELLKVLDEIKNCWVGEDADEFENNAGVYIRNLNIKIEELEHLASFMQIASKRYSNNDETWANKLKEMRKDTLWEQR